MLRGLVAVPAVFAIGVVLLDVFNTIILARRTRQSFRITRALYALTWRPFAVLALRIRSSARREDLLSVYGPLSLLLLVILWAVVLVFAFGGLQWVAGQRTEHGPESFENDVYFSALTLLSLGTAEPRNLVSKVITAVEGLVGFSLLALVISYLPVFYQAFSRRELQISLLDSRAGSPPSGARLLRTDLANIPGLEHSLEVREQWCAELLENMLSFPMMAWFRSQHENQSWLTALTVIVDAAAVIGICADGGLKAQAEFTFAMGRHALADTAAVFRLRPATSAPDRLPPPEFARLCACLTQLETPFHPERITPQALLERRCLYEPYAQVLSDYLLMALPRWASGTQIFENWKARPHPRSDVDFAVSDPFRD